MIVISMGNYNVVGSGTTNGWRKIMQKGIAIESMCVRKATPKCQLRKMTNEQKKNLMASHIGQCYMHKAHSEDWESQVHVHQEITMKYNKL